MSGRARKATIAIASLLAAGALALAVFLASAGGEALPHFPRPNELRAGYCPSDVRVLDRHGEVLHETRRDHARRRLGWTKLEEVSPLLVQAALASEDRRFREHDGVDWLAVVAALRSGLLHGVPRGASTISMQLAALLDPSLERARGGRSLSAKWRQIEAARLLEESWTKDEILEAWLNLVTFRGEVQGVAAAAEAIFGKAAHGLSAEESVVLAASVRAPNATAKALLVRAHLLAAARAPRSTLFGVPIDGHRLDAAVERAVSMPDSAAARRRLAPHLARRFDAVPACGEALRSTLDARLQAFAVETLERHLRELTHRGARDGAVLVADNASGEVLAYVGSSAELSTAADVDGVRARRQAGSTLKPLLYAAAIDEGFATPATLLADEPLEVSVDGNLYRPANYDERFRGLVSLRTALASSLNIPAVRTLLLVGEDAFAEKLRTVGFRGITEAGSWYGPSLALGSADVSLLELVGAYRALAAGGRWSPLRIEPGEGGQTAERIYDEASAWLVADILSDRESRAPSFGLANPLATRFWTAVKTGTSKDMRDNWCIGFSSRYTVGVWVGNFSGEPMHEVSGTSGAAPVWRDIMDELHAETASEAPPRPASVVEAWTVFVKDAEPARRERYRRGTEPLGLSSSLDETASIEAPADGSVFAIDPEIPPARQKLAFRARHGREGDKWILDGREIGSAAGSLFWKLESGRHELEIAGADGGAMDRVEFVVKGGINPASSPNSAHWRRAAAGADAGDK